MRQPENQGRACADFQACYFAACHRASDSRARYRTPKSAACPRPTPRECASFLYRARATRRWRRSACRPARLRRRARARRQARARRRCRRPPPPAAFTTLVALRAREGRAATASAAIRPTRLSRLLASLSAVNSGFDSDVPLPPRSAYRAFPRVGPATISSFSRSYGFGVSWTIVDRRHPCALAPTAARSTSCIRRKIGASSFLANSVNWQYFLHGRWVLSAGAPEEIRAPDPQIRIVVGSTHGTRQYFPCEFRVNKAKLTRRNKLASLWSSIDSDLVFWWAHKDSNLGPAD